MRSKASDSMVIRREIWSSISRTKVRSSWSLRRAVLRVALSSSMRLTSSSETAELLVLWLKSSLSDVERLR